MNPLFAAVWGRIYPALISLRRYDIAVLLPLAALIIAYLWLSPVRVHDLTLQDSYYSGRGEFSIPNSYRPDGEGGAGRTLLHRAQFEYNSLSQKLLHIRTLDCHQYLLLNGVDLMPYNVSGNLCDDYNGAYFDISKLAVKGTNHLEVKTQHIRSHHIVYFGFEISSANLKSPGYLALVCLLASFVFYLVFSRLIRSSLPLYALGIILVALLLRIWVVSNTSALERSHDVYGHIEYMDILINTQSLPEKQKCWSCYHPPYYFGTMAALKVLLKSLGLSEFNLYQFMMLCSVAVHSISLYFGFLTIKRFFHRPGLQLFSMGLFAFLPASVMHSVAINNDQWMFALFCVAFYYFVVWWQTKETRAYYVSLLFAGLCIMVKASGIVMFALLGFFALGYALSQRHDFLLMIKRFGPAAALMFVALLANPMLDKIARPGNSGGFGSIIGNAGGLGSGLTIQNEARNYLHFDPVEFINHPFVHPIDDASGRQYYWTALFKTALYGEFRDFHAHNEGSQLRKAIAPISSLAFLILLAFIIVHAFLMRRENMTRYGPLYALIAICLTASILMRALLPSFPINDFRYIWSIMIAPCVLATLAVDTCRQRNWPMISYIGYAALCASSLVSFIFCISMQ